MRFLAPILSLVVAVAVAQTTCSQNCINIPTGGLKVTAGQPITLTWSNPSSGQITIKLQNGVDNITPNSGTILISDVEASLGTATVTIPSNLPASSSYVFETISEDNTSIINFSNMFSISGATGVSSAVSSTASGASTMSTATRSTASMSSASVSSASSASASSSSASTASSATRTSSESSTRTSSSATSTATTSAPNSANGASGLKVEGAMIALVAGVAALL